MIATGDATREVAFTGWPLSPDVLQFSVGETDRLTRDKPTNRQTDNGRIGDAVSSCHPCERGPFCL